jgi:hypothetical protein
MRKGVVSCRSLRLAENLLVENIALEIKDGNIMIGCSVLPLSIVIWSTRVFS